MLDLNHFTLIESYLPVDLGNTANLIKAFLLILFFIIIRYFIFVGLFYYFFWKKKTLQSVEALHDQILPAKQIHTEIKYSIISSLFFALAGVLIGLLWQKGYTQIYLAFDKYSYGYLVLSFFILTLAHEFYFYFTHRLMHHKLIFKHVHHIHHISRKTSPWASFSFHPYEAIITALFLPVICLVLPLHPTVLISYLVFMTLNAISNHLGFELINNKFMSKIFISGTHHQQHHAHFNSNYGLYYCFIDDFFKTNTRIRSDKN